MAFVITALKAARAKNTGIVGLARLTCVRAFSALENVSASRSFGRRQIFSAIHRSLCGTQRPWLGLVGREALWEEVSQILVFEGSKRSEESLA
jgi:hypothetical protein